MTIQSLLVQDALDRILLDPGAGFVWHPLYACAEEGMADGDRAQVVAALEALAPAADVGGFLRETMLAYLTGLDTHRQAAGALLQRIQPYVADRLMAFVNFEWALSVVHGSGHAEMLGRLRGAGMPELMRFAAQQLGAGAPDAIARRRPDALRRVALVVPFIGDEAHPPTQMALQQSKLLSELGFDVHIFASQDLIQSEMTSYLPTNGRLSVGAPDVNRLGQRVERGVKITLSGTRMSFGRRWNRMLAAVGNFDPDLVMFVGLHSAVAWRLYHVRPVLGMGIHALPPMTPVDAWLTADPTCAGRASSDWGDALPPAHGHYHPFRIQRAPQVETLERAALGIAPGQVVIVSVGGRLDQEINGAWAARMVALLARHADAVWLLVGGTGAMPAALAGLAPERLRLFGYRTDVPAIYRCCDIYVNPPRIGGGLSAGEAMGEGLPVLALAGGDAGSKLGDFAQTDDAEYFAMLERLLASATLRGEFGAALKARFDQTLDLAQAGPSLRAACMLALERFQARS